MKILGRIIVRSGKIAGLYIPISNELNPGIYEIKDILGELIINKLDNTEIMQDRIDALSLEDLFDRRAECGLTQKEYKNSRQDVNQKYGR